MLHLRELPQEVHLLAEARHSRFIGNVALLEERVVLVQCRDGVEEPALIWHSLSRGHKAPVGVAKLSKNLLIQLLDKNGTNWRLWAWARPQVSIFWAINLSFPDCHHHFLCQPDVN